MKFFPELLKKYDSDLAIMSISIDSKEVTEYLLEEKPKPWSFLISDNKSWTFYNDNKSDNSLVKELGVSSYPTYLLFDKSGQLISTPFNGVVGVENELSGIFKLDLSLKTNEYRNALKELPYLIVPYTILVFIILFIQYSIFCIKNLIDKKGPNTG